MALWRQLSRGLRALVNRSAADRDIADEVEHYLDEAAARLEAERTVSRGGATSRATRAWQRRRPCASRCAGTAGNTSSTRRSPTCDTALRRLRRNPAFAIVGALTLALGIGASTAIFSAVNPVLFQPLPYPDAERLMMIWDGQNGTRLDVTFGTYRELIERNRSFESMAVMRPVQPTLTGVAEPERLDGQYVSADYFRVLGVRPALGRDFEAADDQPRPNGPFVAIISDALWRRRFGADPHIVGRQILLNDIPVTVIGIMPAGFENVLSPDGGDLVDPALRPVAAAQRPGMGSSPADGGPRATRRAIRIRRSRSSTRSPGRRWQSFHGRPGRPSQDGFIAEPAAGRSHARRQAGTAGHPGRGRSCCSRSRA